LLGGKGARLVLMDRHPDPLAEVVSGIRETGGEAVDVAGDVREYDDMERAVALAVESYGGLDVLVVPSLWLENSPLVIHEAFMAGVPVVAARIGGIADLIEHGRTGLLYDPNQAGALEAALRSLMETPRRLEDLTVGVQTGTRVRSMTEDADAWDVIYRDVRK